MGEIERFPNEIRYQTWDLQNYGDHIRSRAESLIQAIVERIGMERVRTNDGSYSVLFEGSRGVAAMVVLCEGKASPKLRRTSRDGIRLPDGVYVLLSVTDEQAATYPTMSIAPWWGARYTYFRIAEDANIVELANFVCCAVSRLSESIMEARVAGRELSNLRAACEMVGD